MINSSTGKKSLNRNIRNFCVELIECQSFELLSNLRFKSRSRLGTRRIGLLSSLFRYIRRSISPKLAIVLGVTLSVMLLVVSCKTEVSSLQNLRVGMNNWIGYAIALYAQDAGIFKNRGLEVYITQFNNQQDNIRSTMRGAQELSFVPLWEVMQVDQANDQPVFIMVVDVSAGSEGIS